jgi:ABC-type glutathione transport system ATPase component
MSTQTTSLGAGVSAGPAAALLTASGIEKSYRRGMWPRRRRRLVLRGADLALYPGEVVGLVGENGSGKSVPEQAVLAALVPAQSAAHTSGTTAIPGTTGPAAPAGPMGPAGPPGPAAPAANGARPEPVTH